MSSVLSQPEIRATVEVSYTPERKQELHRLNKNDCPLLITLLQLVLPKVGAKNISILTPKEVDNRIADITIELTIPSKDYLRKVENLIREKGGKSVGKILVLTE